MIYITPEAKSGKGRHIPLHSDAIDYFQNLIAEKVGQDPVLVKIDGKLFVKNNYVRSLLAACNVAKIEPSISFYELRHTMHQCWHNLELIFSQYLNC